MDQRQDRAGAWLTSTSELARVADELDLAQYDQFARRFDEVAEPRRIFFSGQGRSGLSAQMAAMRFMHMGLRAHVVGEATAPSVRRGDTLVLVSGSGATPVSIGYARIARSEEATVLLVTHQEQSELRALADCAVVLPASRSEQFGGTLFEQAALVLLDSVVLDQMRRRGVPAETMTFNHTNLQ